MPENLRFGLKIQNSRQSFNGFNDKINYVKHISYTFIITLSKRKIKKSINTPDFGKKNCLEKDLLIIKLLVKTVLNFFFKLKNINVIQQMWPNSK